MLCTKCNHPILPVVSSDIDGTLAEYHQPLADMAMRFHGHTTFQCDWVGTGDFENYLGLTREEYRTAKLAYRQGGFKRWAPAYPGARDFMRCLAREHAEVWLTTTRPWLRLDSVDPDTRFWLAHQGMKFDHLLYDDDKYKRLAEIVGAERVCAVLEDLPDQYAYAESLFGRGAVIMIARKHNEHFRNYNQGITVASSLSSAAAMVQERIEEWTQKNWPVHTSHE